MVYWAGMPLITQLILVCLSALSFSYALPNELCPAGFPLAGFFCLIPFIIALQKANSWQKGAFLGFVFGLFYHGISSWWLANFKDYTLWTLGATSVFFGVFYGFWSIALQHTSTANRRIRPYLFAVLWTVVEWQKSSGYFAYPWGLLPYSLQSVPVLIQIADIGGIYGLSFLLALSNSVLAEFFIIENSLPEKHFPKKASMLLQHWPFLPVFLLLLAGTVGYGIWHTGNPGKVHKKIPMVLVQHNVDQYYFPEEALRSAVTLSEEGTVFLTAQNKKPAMIVWSETVLTLPYRGNLFYPSHRTILFLQQSNIPVLTGAPLVFTEDEEKIANGAILVQRGAIISGYKKQQLIPFAETIPFSEKKWMRDLMERFAGFSSEWTGGKEATVLKIPGLCFGTPICFEDAFAPLCRNFVREGAELLINLTNDSWSQSISAEVQHLAAARFRSVENRVTLVRSTNSGCTVVIDAEGRTIAELSLFTSAYLAMDIPVQDGKPTLYFLLGDWFPVLCCLLVMGYLILWQARQRK